MQTVSDSEFSGLKDVRLKSSDCIGVLNNFDHNHKFKGEGSVKSTKFQINVLG